MDHEASPRLPLALRLGTLLFGVVGAACALGLGGCGADVEPTDVDDPATVTPATVYARGIDYSWARPGGAAIAARGYRFAARYLSHDRTGKTLTAPEVADLHGHGVGISLVWEDSASGALGGAARGVSDAQEALRQANALGVPGDKPIFFAVDFDATPGQQGVIDAYLRGAASVVGAPRVGVYGGYWVVKRCYENGTAAWGWQTVAWSGGRVHPDAHLYQTGAQDFGGGADINEARRGDYGAWLPGPPPPPPPPGCGRLAPGEMLGTGEVRSSCDGRFALAMQGDGNLVLYQSGVGALWASNTVRPAGGAYTAVMQGDGNFVVYRNGGGALWSSRSYGHGGAFLAIQDDGNLVVYSAAGRPLWNSGTCCR